MQSAERIEHRHISRGGQPRRRPDVGQISSRKLGVPLAGDDQEAVQIAAQLVLDAGCEPVVVGNLLAGRKFERGAPGFRANTTAADLRQRLDLPPG